MIAEVPPSKVSSSDDSAVKPEGPDFSMLPELSASGDMPSTDDGMRSQGDSSISAGLVQLGIDNKSSTDDSASDTDSYAKTKKLRYEDVPWPMCDDYPNGSSDHESEGPWIPHWPDWRDSVRLVYER